MRPFSFVMRKNRELTRGALAAAMYVTLSYMQNTLLPGSATWAIQLRLSEALCILALYSSGATLGLAAGCLLFNLSTVGALPLDPILGPAATLLSCLAMRLTRKLRLRGWPLPALLMPGLFNGLLIGWELRLCTGIPFFPAVLGVAVGEWAVLLTLGSFLDQFLKKCHFS